MIIKEKISVMISVDQWLSSYELYYNLSVFVCLCGKLNQVQPLRHQGTKKKIFPLCLCAFPPAKVLYGGQVWQNKSSIKNINASIKMFYSLSCFFKLKYQRRKQAFVLKKINNLKILTGTTTNIELNLRVPFRPEKAAWHETCLKIMFSH